MAEKTDTPTTGHNRFDKGQIKAYLERFDNLDAEIDKLKEECKAEVEVITDAKKALMRDIERDVGIPVKAMKHFLKERELRWKLARIDDGAEDEVRFMADRLRDVLGFKGTPLGDWAGD